MINKMIITRRTNIRKIKSHNKAVIEHNKKAHKIDYDLYKKQKNFKIVTRSEDIDAFRKAYAEKTIKEICKIYKVSIIKELKKYKNTKLKDIDIKDVIKLAEYLKKK